MKVVTLPKLGLWAAVARMLLGLFPPWVPLAGIVRWLHAQGWRTVDALHFLAASVEVKASPARTKLVYDAEHYTVREAFRDA